MQRPVWMGDLTLGIVRFFEAIAAGDFDALAAAQIDGVDDERFSLRRERRAHR